MLQPLRAWIRWSQRRLKFSGRITRAPFLAWADTSEGRAVVAAAAAQIRFGLFGKLRPARRRLWRGMVAAARDEQVIAAIQREVDFYLERLSALVFSDGLPRVSVELHRLVVVPCVLINGAAYASLVKRLSTQPAIASLEGGDRLREFFSLQVIEEIEAAVARARPSPKYPLRAGRDWISVGVNRAFVWRVPFQAPAWSGHHYVFELTREPITRATRRALAERIRSCEASLPSLSRSERNEILRRAARAA